MIPFRSPLAGLAILCITTSLSFGQSSSKISFQGRLTDSGGTPINNASQSIKFALYKGSTKVWEETQSVNVVDGLYNVLLGSIVPIDTVRFDEPIDLGVKVGADAEMTPRVALAAAATARSLPGLYTFYAAGGIASGYNVVGNANSVSSGAAGAVVLGGAPFLPNEVLADFGTVGGGYYNSSSTQATVAGGVGNHATGENSAIGGGYGNNAPGDDAVVVGGLGNLASGQYAVGLGGTGNSARGSTSLAGGYLARANHDGTFVWGDKSAATFSDTVFSTNTNQFVVRAVNGFGLNKAPVGKGFHLKQTGITHEYGIRFEYSGDSDYWDTWIDGANDYNFAYNNALKAYIKDTDGVYMVNSDATLKEDVRPFDSALSGVLQLHPSTYRFKSARAEAPRSIGFLAQEVQPLFPEVVSEKDGLLGINYGGLSVVAIKAIQELHASFQEQLNAQQAEIERLRKLVEER